MTPSILIAGGGVAGLEATLALRHHGGDDLDITIVSPTSEFVERPVTVAEPFAVAAARRQSLARFAADQRASLCQDDLVAVDTQARTARSAGGRVMEWDALVIAVGARAEEAVPGAITFPGARLDDIVAGVERGTARRIVFAQPGGATWPLPLLDLALLTSVAAHRSGSEGVEVTLVTPEEAPLCRFGGAISAGIAEVLDEAGVRVLAQRSPVRFDGGVLEVRPGEPVTADSVVSAPRLSGPAIPGLPGDADGFVPVDHFGRVADAPGVWAAGDATTFPIKHGGVGAQLADVVAESIAAELGRGSKPEPFHPILHATVMAGLTGRQIDADVSGAAGDPAPPRPVAADWAHRKLAAPFLSRWLDDQAARASRVA